MTDFLTRLAGRSMGLARVAEPVIPAMLLSAAPEAGPTAQNGDPVEAADFGRANALLPRPESESQGPRRMQASRSSMEGEAPHPPEGETARAHPSVEARRQSAPAEARTELAAAEHAPLFAEPVMAQVDRTIPSAEVPNTPAAAREVARHKTTVEREAAPTIRVTIGRVEVRAQFPSPKAERAPAAPPKANALSLDDYLRQRQEGRR